MILRLSHKLNAKIKTGPLKACPLDANPFADWSAHLFVVDRTQYILLTNTHSLYSIVMYGRGITNDGLLIDRALESIREFMTGDGLAFLYHQFMVPSIFPVGFAKALNRSVIGSMNDLILLATHWLTEGELSPHDVGFRLNETPFSCLSVPVSNGYGRPREVFKAMLS